MKSISISDLALEMALEIQKNEPRYHNLDLRLYIEGKGCDGFYYGVSFDEKHIDDEIIDCGKISIVIDKPSLTFCQGSTITWVDDERGKGFLVENPNQKKFRGKFFKRSVWQKRLEEGLLEN